MPKAIVRPGRVYGVKRYPEGTVLDVTQGELTFFSDWLAPVSDIPKETPTEQQLSPATYALMENATVAEVKEMVQDCELAAHEVLIYEQEHKNRSSLIKWLKTR